jgi:hypothetical protein
MDLNLRNQWRARLTATSKGVKAVGSDTHRLKSLLSVVPLAIVKMTTQFVPAESGQIPIAVHQKLSPPNVVFLYETMQRRPGSATAQPSVGQPALQQDRVSSARPPVRQCSDKAEE